MNGWVVHINMFSLLDFSSELVCNTHLTLNNTLGVK